MVGFREGEQIFARLGGNRECILFLIILRILLFPLSRRVERDGRLSGVLIATDEGIPLAD